MDVFSWEQRKCSDFIKLVGGATPSKANKDYWDGDIVWLSSQEIKGGFVSKGTYNITQKAVDDNTTKMIPANTPMFISRSGILANSFPITRALCNVAINQDIKALLFDHTVFSNDYIVHYLESKEQFILKSIVKSGTTVQSISIPDFEKMPINIPASKDEQDRIGIYFENLDTLITLHQREYFAFDFNSRSAKIAQNTLSWEQRKLSEISEKVSKKNQDMVVDEVFTNSAEFGIISQRDYFDKDIANSENIDGYYIVEPNDFVYNPRISTLAPFGPVRRNKLDKSGAMSPLYYVFQTHDVDCGYLEYFFQTNRWHSFMHLNGNSGARSDRFAIRDEVFRDMPISMPQDIEEQKKVGDFFSTLELAITLHQHKPNKKGHDVLTVMPFKGNQRKPHYLCT